MNGRHARRSGARRRALGLAVVGAATGVLGAASTGIAGEPDPSKDKVTLCHATGSKTNPYVEITVNTNAVVNHNNGNLKGHGKHLSDVIPAFSVPRHTPPAPPGDPWPFAGYNVPAGQALIDNKCFPLGIKKTGDATVLPGGTIKYEVAITNLGLKDFPYKAIDVWDKYVPLMPPADPPKWVKPGQVLVWTGSRTVPDSLRTCGRTWKNTATVMIKDREKQDDSRSRSRRSSERPMPPNSSRWMTQVICPLEVAIAKTSTQTSVEPGGTVNYTVRVTNPGPIPIFNPKSILKVEDAGATLTPPAEFPDMLKQGEFLDWAASKSVAADAALCATNVQNTASVSVVKPEQDGPKPVETAKRQNGGGPVIPMWPYTSYPETPVTAAAAPILVAGAICSTPLTPAAVVTALRPAAAALTVAKTGPARALAGGRVTYRVTVTNTGSSEATGVVLRDQPPGAMALVSKPTGSRMEGTAVLWDIGTIPAGQSVSKSIRFTARRTASGRKCNTAFVVATGVETAQARACTVVVAARRPVTPVTG